MYPLYYCISLGISLSYGLSLDAIIIDQHLLEFTSNEFTTSVKCDLGWPWVPRELFLFYHVGYSDGSFIIILVDLKPT